MKAIIPIRDLGSRLPVQGRIRIGEKGAKGQPVKLNAFRFTSGDGDAIEEIAVRYGGTPRLWSGSPNGVEYEVYTEVTSIPVALPPDPLGGTPLYELWSGGGCQRRCDGEVAQIPMSTGDGAEMVDQPCICDLKQVLECKPKTRLTVLLRQISFGGGWRLETGSWNAAKELPGMVEFIQGLQVRGIQTALLALEERVSKRPGKGTRRYVVPVIRTAISIDDLVAGAGAVGSLGLAEPLPELEAGVVTPPPSSVTVTNPDWDDDIVDAEIVEEVEPPPATASSTKLKQRAMHAILREVGFGDDERHAMVLRVTKGRSQSSNDVDEDEMMIIIKALDAIRKGQATYEGTDEKGWAQVVAR